MFVTVSDAPAAVQPVRLPVSKPPFVMPIPPPPEVTVSVTVVECEPEAAVPVTVSVYVPAVAELVDERVRVAVWPELTEAGVTVAVTPDGAPETEMLTVCALPLVVAVLIVDEPELPAAIVTPVGLAEIEKSFVATVVTFTVTVVECVTVPSVPVIVRV
jgi:hypothetical protein